MWIIYENPGYCKNSEHKPLFAYFNGTDNSKVKVTKPTTKSKFRLIKLFSLK